MERRGLTLNHLRTQSVSLNYSLHVLGVLLQASNRALIAIILNTENNGYIWEQRLYILWTSQTQFIVVHLMVDLIDVCRNCQNVEFQENAVTSRLLHTHLHEFVFGLII